MKFAYLQGYFKIEEITGINLFIEWGPACHLTLFVGEIIFVNLGFSLILGHQNSFV